MYLIAFENQYGKFQPALAALFDTREAAIAGMKSAALALAAAGLTYYLVQTEQPGPENIVRITELVVEFERREFGT